MASITTNVDELSLNYLGSSDWTSISHLLIPEPVGDDRYLAYIADDQGGRLEWITGPISGSEEVTILAEGEYLHKGTWYQFFDCHPMSTIPLKIIGVGTDYDVFTPRIDVSNQEFFGEDFRAVIRNTPDNLDLLDKMYIDVDRIDNSLQPRSPIAAEHPLVYGFSYANVTDQDELSIVLDYEDSAGDTVRQLDTILGARTPLVI